VVLSKFLVYTKLGWGSGVLAEKIIHWVVCMVVAELCCCYNCSGGIGNGAAGLSEEWLQAKVQHVSKVACTKC
jgi:hypothetical protein